MNVIQEIMRFQTDRELPHQNYTSLNEHINIIEELVESMGYNIVKEDRIMLASALEVFMTKLVGYGIAIKNDVDFTNDDIVDAYGDIIVFAIGAIMKLDYNPETVLDEVAKEINSREGEIIDGKFEKHLDDEHRAKWYKADFSKCKL